VTVNMDKGVSEKTVSEEKDTINIATIAAVDKAIKDNAGHRQFRYNGEKGTRKYWSGQSDCTALMCRQTSG
jgi:hypothetical protein